MAFQDKKLASDWQNTILKEFLNKNMKGVEEFLKSFIDSKRKKIERRLPYLDMLYNPRNSSCDCCSTKMEKNTIILRISGEKFCALCGYILVTSNYSLFSTFVEKLKNLGSKQ